MEKPLLSIITCFYNEEETIDDYFTRVNQVVAAQVDFDVELVCVNDGSTDGTLQKLIAAAEGDRRICVLDLARNFGKEAAMTAGLDTAIGDVVVILDADLQDPPELIGDMLRLWYDGYEVVLGRRIDRMSDSFLKRATAQWFYRLHNMLAEIPLPHDVGDFRLMDRQVVLALRQLPERQRFMKGIFAWLGFKQAIVDYVRPPRAAGQSKFSGWSLWNLALEGITSFSTVPLRIWTYFGLFVSLAAFGYGTFIILKTLIMGREVPGYASLLVTMLFIGGVNLIGIGVLGEYLGRVYMETKSRPIYIIRRKFSKGKA